jgi:hypothetical protein
MADNIEVLPGTGSTKTVATDERTIGGTPAHVQRVAQSLGPEGTHTGNQSGRLVDGTASEAAAYVDPRILAVTVKVTPTVSTSPAYSAKDAVGALMTFAGCARANGGTGRIVRVTVEDKGQQMAALDLVIFSTAPAAPTDNSVFAPSDAELATDLCEGVIPISAGAYSDFSTNSIATVPCSLPYKCASGSTSLTGVLVARGTPTYTSTSDLVVTIFVEQD